MVKLAVVDKSVRHRTKVRPDGITLAAKDNLPIKDNSSLFVHFLRLSQKARLDSTSDSLSVGSCTHIFEVSINIPRNTRAIVGPMIFSRANGIPSCSKTLITLLHKKLEFLLLLYGSNQLLKSTWCLDFSCISLWCSKFCLN